MDFEIFHFDLLDSTMNKARELLESGLKCDFIVIADFQTAGRGRIEGRNWAGAAGSSLLMTIVKRETTGIPAIPLRVGLGALEALEALSMPKGMPRDSSIMALKWPNDLLGTKDRNAKKLGGILCESTGHALLAGMGINLGKNAYPSEIADESTSLQELGLWDSFPASRDAVENLAVEIANKVDFRLGDERWQPEYSRQLWGKGKTVNFLLGHPSRNNLMTGRLEGVDSAGRILLRDESGNVHAYESGEISGFRAL
jgi:BirA family biotin operon repressor/biotin-[acetyl-CoA-carboxylase] ligase